MESANIDDTSANSQDVYTPKPPNAAEVGHYLSEEEGSIIHTTKQQWTKLLMYVLPIDL